MLTLHDGLPIAKRDARGSPAREGKNSTYNNISTSRNSSIEWLGSNAVRRGGSRGWRWLPISLGLVTAAEATAFAKLPQDLRTILRHKFWFSQRQETILIKNAPED